ncbi:LysR family transcriptional regulator [Colwellia sp. BRX8-7]|jgi:DNA-binding transcriptional LysR family regulator|uniref:LysR family transcriptional regulator n=1 Tax=Colwellia sp. BRX8-7 TaxID=2759833 RepID=UPI0015F637CE|nr:LysR family transcriptional regulator [Colwellia sp. BRX8-7]MBA6338181.1 LysR family transcriptional regulator [Colwellia sp. BRX8-7]
MRPHELKLLVIFDVIMTEKSITQAAERLSMTQPAVSNAVARMRILWKDELLVPDGRKIKPTAYAKNLWEQVRDSLHNINQAIEPEDFEARSAMRTFRVALPDIALDTLWLDLRKLFEKEAPGLNLHAVPYTIACTKPMLDGADVDLVIGQSNRSLENICTDHLFDTSYVCVMRKDHPLTKKRLTVEEFSLAEHLLVSLSGDIASPTDQALQQLGLTRRIAFTVNKFSSAVPIIKESDLIAILPTDLIHNYLDCGELAIAHPPVDIPHSSISMLWHKRQSADKGLMWLRKQIKQIFIKRRTDQVEKVLGFIDS